MRHFIDLSSPQHEPYTACHLSSSSNCSITESYFGDMSESVFKTQSTFSPITISRNRFEHCTATTIDIIQNFVTEITLKSNFWLKCSNPGYYQILCIDCSGYGTTNRDLDAITNTINENRDCLDYVWDESKISNTNVSDVSLNDRSSLILIPQSGLSSSQSHMIYSRLRATNRVVFFWPESNAKSINASYSNFVDLDTTTGYHFYTQNILTIVEESFISLKDGQDSIRCYAYGALLQFQNCCIQKPISSTTRVTIMNSKDFSICTMISVPVDSGKNTDRFQLHFALHVQKSFSKLLFIPFDAFYF